jgi:glycosyltransferase involved in cell wall biosynthesis
MSEPADRKKRLARAFTGLVLRLALPVVRLLTRSTRTDVRRSLWAGTPILTLPVKAKAERLLGVKADTLVFQTYYITSDFRYDLSRWNRGPGVWRSLILPLGVLLWAACRYQRFHYFCDRGLLPGERFEVREDELRFLRALRKELFFYTYGADVRTRHATLSLGEPNCCMTCPEPGRFCICDDEAGAKEQAKLRTYATGIFALGDMVHYTPGSRNDLYFWPIDLSKEDGKRYEPRYPDPEATGPVKVVHAPNHQGFKGTPHLIAAVKRLQDRGLPVELQLVERVPNREALEIYRGADVVFDQCLIGYHGYFALEAMAMGKPVCVFLRDPVLAPDECPLVNVRPETVEMVLEELIQDRPRLHELGRQGRRYIERHYTVEAFTKRLGRALGEVGQTAQVMASGVA